MGNDRIKQGQDHSWLGGIKAIAGTALAKNTIVWVSARSGRRRSVTEAGGDSTATGGDAPLFVTIGGAATAGDTVSCVDRALITNRDSVTGVFSVITAIAGSSAGDSVYLKDGGGITLLIAEATLDRKIGAVVDLYSWEFGAVAGRV